MGRVDFVVPICADQHQVPHIGLGQKILEQVKRCRVEPLQIVKEQCEWVLGPREYVDKSPEYQLKTALRVLWRKLRDGWLFSYYGFNSGTRSTMSWPFGPGA